MERRVSFAYERALTPIGFTWIPMARVSLSHWRRRLELDMTCDSGADLTMVPFQVGKSLGMRRGTQTIATLSGIAGGTPYLLRSVTLRLGPIRLRCRLAWAQSEDVPMLLGRTDVFDRLRVTFDGRRRRVTFRQ